MKGLSLTAAFKSYGAALTNPRWSVSAKADDGSIVISCWEKLFSKGMVYSDRLSRWEGNKPGNAELRQLIAEAKDLDLPVRLIVAHLEDNAALDGVWGDASAIKKNFSTRPDVVGRIIAYDGDMFTIVFSKSSQR